MNFTEEYSKIKKLTTNELSAIEKIFLEEIKVRQPLCDSLIKFLTSPSKRIRPVLAILLAKSYGTELSAQQLNFLSVIEIIHNASLIHDDIIDECNIRRGEKTIGAKFDNKLAVISGDYLLALAMNKLTEIGNPDLIKKVVLTISQMCIGEINQNFDRFKIGTIEDYIEKTKNKTAYLFETALFGTMLLGNQEYDAEKIKELGINIGTAFQIRDDIINITSTGKDKPAKNDIKEGIYNAPVILGSKEDNYTSGIEKTKVLLNNYTDNAAKIINKLPKNQYSAALLKFLELLENV